MKKLELFSSRVTPALEKKMRVSLALIGEANFQKILEHSRSSHLKMTKVELVYETTSVVRVRVEFDSDFGEVGLTMAKLPAEGDWSFETIEKYLAQRWTKYNAGRQISVFQIYSARNEFDSFYRLVGVVEQEIRKVLGSPDGKVLDLSKK